jgi:hypothetical protein
MCDSGNGKERRPGGSEAVRVEDSVGMILAHDITEIRPGAFKGRAFKKGYVVRPEDIDHLKQLGKEHLYLLSIGEDEMHENDAAFALARALAGDGVRIEGEPKEGKINLLAAQDGLLCVDSSALRQFNMLGEVMCATLHDRTLVKKGQVIAGTRAIPLVAKRRIVEEAVRITLRARNAECGVRNGESEKENSNFRPNSFCGLIQVKELRRPNVGIVITGNEVYHGRIKDAFAPVLANKIAAVQGEIAGIYYAPDDAKAIEDRLQELVIAGADLLITTGGMSVDPDDVTRFAISSLGATSITYGSAVLPGAMFLIAYLLIGNYLVRDGKLKRSSHRDGEIIPILGIPACGMYAKTTVFDLILPRVLAGEMIGRRELAELGHGGLCLQCPVCRYPVCPFGKV